MRWNVDAGRATKIIRRIVALLLLVVLLAAACTAESTTIEPTAATTASGTPGAEDNSSDGGAGDSGVDGASDEQDGDAAAASDDAEPPATSDDVENEENSSAGLGEFSVLGALELIPASAAADAGSSTLEVSVADVDAAADQARLRRPADPTDADQVLDFIGPLTGFSRDDRVGRLFVPYPRVLVERAISQIDDFVDEVGFSPSDVTFFAAIAAPPAQLTVFGGVTPPAGLPEVAPGITTLGDVELDDFEVAPQARTPARPLGRPLRVAERDGLTAFSLATSPLTDFERGSGSSTLADNEQFATVASRLDEEAVVSASLFTQEGFAYRSVGLGWSADDRGPRGVIVLHYDTAAAAEEQLPLIAEGFAGDSLISDGAIADLIVLDSIEVRGSEIVAVVTFPDDRDPITLYQMFIRQDIPFAPTGP